MKHYYALKVERISKTCSTSIVMFIRIHIDMKHMDALKVERNSQTWISNHKTTLSMAWLWTLECFDLDTFKKINKPNSRHSF